MNIVMFNDHCSCSDPGITLVKSNIFQEVLHTIASPHGRVSRIVIHNKTEEKIESLIEFDSIMSAEACKDAINGADIYAGCCTLDVKFSKVSVRLRDRFFDLWYLYRY